MAHDIPRDTSKTSLAGPPFESRTLHPWFLVFGGASTVGHPRNPRSRDLSTIVYRNLFLDCQDQCAFRLERLSLAQWKGLLSSSLSALNDGDSKRIARVGVATASSAAISQPVISSSSSSTCRQTNQIHLAQSQQATCQGKIHSRKSHPNVINGPSPHSVR